MAWPMVVALIAVMVASVAVSFVLAGRVQGQKRKPSGLSEFQVPTAEVGREIPVLFGTRLLKGPNVVWYGDLRTRAIKK